MYFMSISAVALRRTGTPDLEMLEAHCCLTVEHSMESHWNLAVMTSSHSKSEHHFEVYSPLLDNCTQK